MLALYRSLLNLYPAAYRSEYGEEMMGVLLEVDIERKRKGLLAGITIAIHESTGLLYGALQEHVRAITGSSRWEMFPQRRFAMKSDFRFPKATVTLMAIILLAILLAIDKAKAISAAVPHANPPIGPIHPSPLFSILPSLVVATIVACVGGAVGWAVLFVLHRSGTHRLSEVHPTSSQRSSGGPS